MEPNFTWDLLSSELEAKNELSPKQSQWAMHQLLSGLASKEDLIRFLMGIHDRGERSSELDAFLNEMLKFALPISISERSVDIVGTGGDGKHTINISTAAAIVAAASGARTVKHGSRAATSKSGSADCLQALGVNIDLDGGEIAQTVNQLGIGFCFAQKFHAALRFAAPARKEISVPTVFNILGPLANPARPKAIALGVANSKMLPVMAKVLLDRGVEGFVFRGDDGLDEISLETTTTVLQISDNTMREEKFNPRNLNINPSPITALRGGDPEYNANVVKEIFDGKLGAQRDAVVLNAAAGIAAFSAEFKLSIDEQFAKGLALATQAIDSGAAKKLLSQWATLSQDLVAKRLS